MDNAGPPAPPQLPPPPQQRQGVFYEDQLLQQGFDGLSIAQGGPAPADEPPSDVTSVVVPLPPRPGFGTTGTRVALRANHFRLTSGALLVSQYRVDITARGNWKTNNLYAGTPETPSPAIP